MTPIDEYISTFPKEVQVKLQEIKSCIKKIVPDAEECINYGIPTFKHHGNLVHFAGYKNHIGFYPGAAGIFAFKDELAAYKSAKGSVQFPLEKPIPFELIAEITLFRKMQNVEMTESKRKKKKKKKKNPNWNSLLLLNKCRGDLKSPRHYIKLFYPLI